MAIKLISNYAKRLGLPGYSSHQFSVSVETELHDLERVPGEMARLYQLLQQAVDREIQQTGFVPGDDYGLHNSPASRLVSLSAQEIHYPSNGNGNGHTNGNGNTRWACSDKQKEFILKLVTEHGLDREVVEEISLNRFGVGVKLLNKLQASGLIAELLELVNQSQGNGGNGSNGNNGNGSNGSRPRAAARKGGRP
jgi:hypothetical protein